MASPDVQSIPHQRAHGRGVSTIRLSYAIEYSVAEVSFAAKVLSDCRSLIRGSHCHNQVLEGSKTSKVCQALVSLPPLSIDQGSKRTAIHNILRLP
jgi:hypothetical protein